MRCDYYESLAIYRADIIIPLGFASMLVKSVLFAWIYDRMFATASSSMGALMFNYAVLGAAMISRHRSPVHLPDSSHALVAAKASGAIDEPEIITRTLLVLPRNSPFCGAISRLRATRDYLNSS